MVKNKCGLLFVILLALGFSGCENDTVFSENRAMDDNVWMSDDIKTFSIEVTDTISPLDIFVNLRTTTDYPYSNIYVFLYSEFPNGVTDKDTLQFLLAESDGKWLGESSGTIVEFTGLIARGGRFSTAGTYVFKMQHGMREEALPEVIDIGLKVKKTEIESAEG